MTIDKNPLDLAREWVDANKVRDVIKRTPTWEDSAQAENLLCLLLDELRALLPTPTPRTLADMTPEEREACRLMAAEVVTARTWFIIGENPARPGWWIVVTRSGRIESRLPEHITPLPDLPRMEWPDGEPVADDTREPEQAPAHPAELVTADDYENAPHGTIIGDYLARPAGRTDVMWQKVEDGRWWLVGGTHYASLPGKSRSVIRWGDGQ